MFGGFIGLGTIVEAIAIIQSLYWEGFRNGNGYWLTSVAFRTTGLLVNFITRSKCANTEISCPFSQDFNHNAVMRVFIIMAAPLYYEAWHSWQGPPYLLELDWSYRGSRKLPRNPSGPGYHEIKTRIYGSTSGKARDDEEKSNPPSIVHPKNRSSVQFSNPNFCTPE